MHKPASFGSILKFSLHYLGATFALGLLVLPLEMIFKVPYKNFIGWIMLGLLVLMDRVKAYKQPPARFVFLALASLISLRYIYWRTFFTLVYTDPFSFAATIVLYAAELYLLGTHLLGILVGLWPLERNAAAFDTEAPVPAVDVYIPTYSESLDIVKLTATAAKNIFYPEGKLKIYILDDGGTTAKRNSPAEGAAARERHAAMSALAAELGIGYIAREQNNHAKAGNVNYALPRTGGDLILLLDCDHVPTRDILSSTVGFFQKDPKLALVQTPHFLGNPSIIEKNIGSFSNSPRENDMFYNMIHRAMDFWNASYFCGSAAVLSRHALLAVRGLSTDTITEDVETSVKLHKHGYNSVYYRRPLVCGLQPATFAAYVIQRMRWAQGMVQIFMLHNPLFQKGLTLPQKMCYFNACYFWFFSFSRLVMYFGPILFLTFGLKIYHASPEQVLSFTFPHVFSIFAVMFFFYGNTRRLFFSEIYESAQMMFMAPAVVSTILNPRKPVFKITPKDGGVSEDALNLTGAMPFFFIFLANAAAIPFAVYKWIHFPLYRDVILIGNFWCFYNMLIAIMTLGAFYERREFRSAQRFNLSGKAELFHHRLGRVFEGQLGDASLTGLRLCDITLYHSSERKGQGEPVGAEPPLLDGDAVSAVVADHRGEKYTFKGKIRSFVSKENKLSFGLELENDSQTYSDMVKYLYGDSGRWAEILRARNQDLMFSVSADLYHFIKRGLQGLWPCLTGSFRYTADYLYNRGFRPLSAAGRLRLDGILCKRTQGAQL